MGLEAIYQKPNTSRRHPDHKIYPYLLRGLVIDRPNQVWCADITYIPMARGFVYLVAVMDWFSRRILAWRVVDRDGDGFLRRGAHGGGWIAMANPACSTRTKGSSSPARTSSTRCTLGASGSAWTARGRFLDNIFIERLWRSLKYEEVFIKAYASVAAARGGIGAWLAFYNDERPHQALGYRTPREVFEADANLWICGQRSRCATLHFRVDHISTGTTTTMKY